jgi:hypothetical protein
MFIIKSSRMKNEARFLIAAAVSAALSTTVQAAGVPGKAVEEVTVTATRSGELFGHADSASEGTVLAAQLETRPVLRTGEVLEVVPGLVVTQHSGDGKANQYFLRGFNLDHGTDFASRVEGMPVNMPTHAHGQGYSDINFMIPELVDRMSYKKGTYYAEEGNFSAAGAVDVIYKRSLEQSFAVLGGGQDSYGRVLVASSPQVTGGDLLMAVDSSYANGPWELNENIRKLNGVLKFTRGDADAGFSLAAMGYSGRWKSTDQIPLRAVEAGIVDRFGYIDPNDGGRTRRYSVNGSWWSTLGEGKLRVEAYGIDYQLDLFSNFTYFTDQENGDQFEQFDDRLVLGTQALYEQPLELFGKRGTFSAGVQIRHDDIAPVGLYKTQARERLDTVREDEVVQTSYGVFVSQNVNWTNWLRTEGGVRFDEFRFDVNSSLAANSGKANDSIVSPKLTTVFGPWKRTELFLNWGRGFHSNDARGTTITVDPTDGVTPADHVTPLVRAVGEELGVRTAIVPHVQIAASLWRLTLDSELLFIGDGGSTEATRASRRTGLELSAYYAPTDSIIVDADVAWARPRFSDDDPAGDRIPNAVERVVSVGLSYRNPSGWFGGARLRYLGPAALIEDDSVRSESTTLLNLNVGYYITRNVSASVSLLNAMDEKANDITYFYESQLSGEAAPVDDIHFHPAEPRQVRAAVTARF